MFYRDPARGIHRTAHRHEPFQDVTEAEFWRLWHKDNPAPTQTHAAGQG